MEDKEDNRVIENLLAKAKVLNYGILLVEFKVQDGKILQGEIKEKIEKL